MVDYARGLHDISLRRACDLIGICDSVYRYRPAPHRDDEVIAALQEVSERYPAYGFSKLLKVLRRWSIDFMSDALMCGRRFRTFNVLDDFNREVLAIEIDLSLPAARVIRVLERVIAWRGCPAKLRMDNGPEFISSVLAEWAEERGIKLEFIKPGTPTQNSFVEQFNRTYRDEVLNMYAFKALTAVREITERWMPAYNEERPHNSLGDLTP